MWTIDSLCVSSYSSACARAAFAYAAVPTPTGSPVPMMWLRPGGDSVVAACRTERPNGVPDAASARPMTSSVRSLDASTTSDGRSSNVIADTQSASCNASGTLMRAFKHTTLVGRGSWGVGRGEYTHANARTYPMNIPITDPLAHDAMKAIHKGDLTALRQLLAEHPALAAARIIDRKGSDRTLLHVATDWPGHFPAVADSI